MFYGQCQRQVLLLLSITLQVLHFVSPPFVTFRSLSAPSLGYPRKSASIHSIPLKPTRSFIPLPFGFPSHRPETQSQNGKLHSTQPHSLHCIQSTPLLFPMPTSGMPCVVFTPEPHNPQKPHRPLMVQVKIKKHSRKAMCLQPVRFTHSTVRFDARSSRRRSLFHFVHLTSFSTARVSVSFLNTHTFPIPQQQHSGLFLPAILFAPQNPLVIGRNRFK